MEYRTMFVMHLITGEPFTFEVCDEKVDWLEKKKDLLKLNEDQSFGFIKLLIRSCEYSLFPSFSEVLDISEADGYGETLVHQILTDFGLDEEMIKILLTDKKFVSLTKPWFEDSSYNEESASRTLGVVYFLAKEFIKLLYPVKT